VDQHFGHAEIFRIYVVEGTSILEHEGIDVREQQEIPLFGPGHRTKIESTVEKLKGVDAVVSTKFGEPAIEMLRENGIIPIEDAGDIKYVLRKAADSIFKERSKTFE
jgi:nitrogen fixation protein NifB